MDITFIEGVAATVSAIIVFCGSVFLLIMMLTGARLAYFVTASVTLAFMVIMGVVWSINPLGPVGTLPEFEFEDTAPTADQIDFGPASQYPGDPWHPADEEDDLALAQIAELENAAAEAVEFQLAEGQLRGFEVGADVAPVEEGSLLLEQDGQLYGMTTFEQIEGPQRQAVVLMKYDPGNPLGQARLITAGSFVLLVLHLFGLSRAEKRAARRAEERNATT